MELFTCIFLSTKQIYCLPFNQKHSLADAQPQSNESPQISSNTRLLLDIDDHTNIVWNSMCMKLEDTPQDWDGA